MKYQPIVILVLDLAFFRCQVWKVKKMMDTEISREISILRFGEQGNLKF